MTIRMCDSDCKFGSTQTTMMLFAAADGVAGIAEARKHMPDLVILDLGLPGGDGFSVLERLKANEKLSSIPVMVLSGRARVGNRNRALKAGARTFLQTDAG
jgi:DNA-binding response OmpR family regulator